MRVLESARANYWSGDQCKAFEAEFAEYHGVSHSVAVANGTVALELALIALGLGDGDEVLVTPRSFFASASCIVRVGARPVFVDVDVESQNVTAASMRPAITSRTRAIVAVHLAGWPCDMPEIMALARDHNLLVIEDCAQAHGARFHGKPVGSFGDAAAFSFCQDKIISTAGEGGIVLISDGSVYDRAWQFRDHGKDRARVESTCHPIGFRWLHTSFGTNWRLTEIQGAIGRLQLRKLDSWVLRRRENARRLHEHLSPCPVARLTVPPEHVYHAYYKYYFFIKPDALRSNWSRDRILEELEAEGIPGLSGSCPAIYKEAAFSSRPETELPIAGQLGETSVMLMVHPTLTEADIEFCGDVLRRVLKRAAR